MTEYKFRVWDGNTMYTKEFAAFHFGRNNYWSCYYDKDNGGHYCCDSTEKDTVLRQFIGLRDMHGMEIYTGDVIRGDTYNGSYADGIVEYRSDGYVLIPIEKFVEGVCDIYDNLHFLDVIGNIYENPELL